jgi:hypothetical protein
MWVKWQDFRAGFLTSNDGIIATKILQLKIYDRKCITEQYTFFFLMSLFTIIVHTCEIKYTK